MKVPTMHHSTGRSTSSGFRDRDTSPNSVIHTSQSNLSLFSSTSGSAERCSFASDFHDHDSHKLRGQEYSEGSSSGQDLDPEKVINRLGYKGGHVSKKEKVKVKKFSGSEVETEEGILYLDSARSSFSQALKECQDRRLRSEAVLKKEDNRRPASLDLNKMVTSAASSPRLAVVKKASEMARQSGMFPSPVTPNYRHTSVGVQKGWSSERVPHHTNTNRRHVNTALFPYNNGRALPSKWEDAERWIFSPVLGDSNQRSYLKQQQPKPKSKSGPLGPPGVAYYSMYSPAVPMFEGRNVRNEMTNFPFSDGAMAADGMSNIHSAHARLGNLFMRPQPFIARSVSLHGCSELMNQSSLPGPQDLRKVDETRDAATDVSRAASRRDMATQMSPERSPFSSPVRSSSCSVSTPSILPTVELPSNQLSRSEIRDVEVDEGVTITRWSKKNKALIPRKKSGNNDDWRKKATEVVSSSWENLETSRSISKVQREEARIIAWENLQKAKAEAAMRKLEVKLEKKRSSSMDKIMNKLRSAQKKAQQMRSSAIPGQSQQVSKTSNEALPPRRRTHQMGSLSGCFTCPAF